MTTKTESILTSQEHTNRPNKAEMLDQTIASYLQAIAGTETPPASACAKLARAYQRQTNYTQALHWALATVDGGDDYLAWLGAAAVLDACDDEHAPVTKQTAKLALLGSYTTTQFVPLLKLAARRIGLHLDIYESPYGQFQQAILDPNSEMYAFSPDFVVLAVHEGDLRLPNLSEQPDKTVDEEAQRWASLWQRVADLSGARVVQHNFVPAADQPFGHLGTRLPECKYSMIQKLNTRLGQQAGNKVLIVDCQRLATQVGRDRWRDPRYWHLSKQAVSLQTLPLLARHTAAVIAADLGLTRKCLVLDLDNTLWGGVIGEVGLTGIELGDSVRGQAFVAFQEYILQLKNKGVILAVCSKNDEARAKEAFEKHPEMRIKLDDISMFVANWQPKPNNIRKIAETLNIGLDSLVFVDDSPVERESIRQLVPEVDVLVLGQDPSYYVRTLSDYLMFETSAFTADDARRNDQYRARAQVAQAQETACSLEEFYRSLQMKAVLAPFDAMNLPRIVQLIGKTNQFNLTTRRHNSARIESFMTDPACVHYYLRLSDRFSDHGLVSLLIAMKKGNALEIDTWLMSCRVIGRTVENLMFSQLCVRAKALGCRTLVGRYIPTPKNDMVKDLFKQFGFTQAEDEQGQTIWIYTLDQNEPTGNEFIEIVNGAGE